MMFRSSHIKSLFSRVQLAVLIPFFFFLYVSCGGAGSSGGVSPPAQTYRVTLNHNQGAASKTTEMDVEIGTKVPTPKADAVLLGYSIGSWNTKSDGSGKTWNFATDLVDSDVNLFAQWVLGQSHKSNDPEPQAPTKENKAFLGWYKSKAFTKIADRVDFENQPGGTFTIYPKFVDAAGYTITSDGVLNSVPSTATVEIPYSVNKIAVKKLQNGSSLFGATSLNANTVVTKVHFPTRNLEKIGSNAFQSTKGLSRITVPGNITDIESSAFESSGISAITLSAGLKKIGTSAFLQSGLTFITIPSTVETIGDTVFSGLPGSSDGRIPGVPSKIVEVKMESSTPPTLGSNVFAVPAAGFQIKVPSAAVDTYKNANGWRDYRNKIVGY